MEFWFVYSDGQCEKQNLHFMLRWLSVSCTSLYSLGRVTVCRKDFTWMIIIMCVHNTQNNNLLLTANITLSVLVFLYLMAPMELFYCTIVQCAILQGVHNITQAGSTYFKIYVEHWLAYTRVLNVLYGVIHQSSLVSPVTPYIV